MIPAPSQGRRTTGGPPPLRTAPELRLPSRRVAAIGGATLGLCVLAAAVFGLAASRGLVLLERERELSNLSVVLSEQTARAVHAADVVLQSVRQSAGRGLPSPAFSHALLSQAALEVPQIRALGLFDAAGGRVADSRAYPAPPRSAADRAYFAAHRHERAGDDRLFVDDPVLSRTDGRWLITLSRRIDGPDGVFAGVAAAGVDPSYFTQVFQAINLGTGAEIALIRLPGTLVAQEPPRPSALGRPDPALASLLEDLGPAPRLRRGAASADGRPTLVAVHRVGDYPLAVMVAARMDEVLAPWRLIAAVVAAATGLFLALLALVVASIRRQGRREERFARARSAEARRLEAILVATADGLVTVDDAGIVRSANPAAARMFGHAGGDPSGRPLDLLLSRPGDPAAGDGTTFEAQGRRADGSVFPCEVSFGRPVPDPDEPDRWLRIATLRDVSERKRVEAELIAAKQAAESANEAKSAFLAKMSHELRTPLNAIIGFSDIIRSRLFGDAAVDRYVGYAEDIHASGEHLLAVINDILDMAKIEAGRFELQEEPLDPAGLADEALRFVRPQAERRSVALLSEVPAGLPLLLGDRRAIRQVLINLLSNAVKFTEPGGRVVLSAEAGDGGLSLRVSDTGIGIAPEALARIFEPFRQGDERLSRAFQGTGLGLSISRSLMDLHGGALSVASEPGRGTRVSAVFPASRLVPPARAA
jgi:PAS domain S-box-containing protein